MYVQDSGDPDFTGMLTYMGFRTVFLEICNPLKELTNRGVRDIRS